MFSISTIVILIVFFHFLCLFGWKSFILDIEKKKWTALWHGQHIKLPIQHHFYSRISHSLGFWYIGTTANGSFWPVLGLPLEEDVYSIGYTSSFYFHRSICYLRQCSWQLNWCLDTGGRNITVGMTNPAKHDFILYYVSNNGGLVEPTQRINSALSTILLSRVNVVSG